MKVKQLLVGHWYFFTNCKGADVYCIYIGAAHPYYPGEHIFEFLLGRGRCSFSKEVVGKSICLPPKHFSEYLNLFCERIYENETD